MTESRAEYYKQKAVEASSQAEKATDYAAKEAYRRIAEEWLVMARQADWFDRSS